MPTTAQPPQKKLTRIASDLAYNFQEKVARGSSAIAKVPENTVYKVERMMYKFEIYAEKLNTWADKNRYFGGAFAFKERRAKLTTELRAGTVTFLMVAYILALNPSILATTGGPCNPEKVCAPENYQEYGVDCLLDPDDQGAMDCMETLSINLLTATAAASLISTFFIGFFANLPLAICPGIGINVYFAYQVIGTLGRGSLTWEQGMVCIFIEGWIFTLLSVSGLRGLIIRHMPRSIMLASSVGIGLLLAFTGLRSLQLVGFDPWTLVALTGCSADDRNYVYVFETNNETQSVSEGVLSNQWGCEGKEMRSASLWLGIAGGFISAFALYAGVKAPLFLGIAFVTIISWIPGHGASYLGSGSSIPGGEERLEYFSNVVAVPSLSLTGLAWDWGAFNTGTFWITLFTLLYIDLLDCTGTLIAMAGALDRVIPNFMSEKKEFPGQMWAFLADGIGIIVGSMMGTTPLSVYLESAAGIEEGGRTGITAIVVACFFFISLFFAPIFGNIPPYATGPALILAGILLTQDVRHIEWDNPGDSIPAFLTIIIMPFTLSVAYGVIAGVSAYIILNSPVWIWDRFLRRWFKKNGDSDGESMQEVREKRKKKRSKMWYQHSKHFSNDDILMHRTESERSLEHEGFMHSQVNFHPTLASGLARSSTLGLHRGVGGSSNSLASLADVPHTSSAKHQPTTAATEPFPIPAAGAQGGGGGGGGGAGPSGRMTISNGVAIPYGSAPTMSMFEDEKNNTYDNNSYTGVNPLGSSRGGAGSFNIHGSSPGNMYSADDAIAAANGAAAASVGDESWHSGIAFERLPSARPPALNGWSPAKATKAFLKDKVQTKKSDSDNSKGGWLFNFRKSMKFGELVATNSAEEEEEQQGGAREGSMGGGGGGGGGLFQLFPDISLSGGAPGAEESNQEQQQGEEKGGDSLFGTSGGGLFQLFPGVPMKLDGEEDGSGGGGGLFQMFPQSEPIALAPPSDEGGDEETGTMSGPSSSQVELGVASCSQQQHTRDETVRKRDSFNLFKTRDSAGNTTADLSTFARLIAKVEQGQGGGERGLESVVVVVSEERGGGEVGLNKNNDAGDEEAPPLPSSSLSSPPLMTAEGIHQYGPTNDREASFT